MNAWRALVVVAVAGAACAQPPPDASEAAKLLDGIREAVHSYDDKLPNFICSQVTTRESMRIPDARVDPRSQAGPRLDLGWQRVDNFEQQLSYFERHESYRLMKMNGKAPAKKQKTAPGATSTGEFGTTLSNIFDPRSHTEFLWNRWDSLRGRKVAVFAYKVDVSDSLFQLVTPVAKSVVGYRGLIFADRESGTVLRVTTEADSPRNFPFQGTKHTLDYGVFSIAGEQFVLPMRDEMQFQASQDFVQFGKLGGNSAQVLMRNHTEFRDYRRYTAESELKFEPEPK